MKKNTIALMLSCVMLISSFTGCSDSKSKTEINEGGKPAVTTPSPLPPGEEFKADFGKEFVYEKKNFTVEFLELAKIKDVEDDDGSVYALVFQATNNGDEERQIWMLDDFNIKLDDVQTDSSKIYNAYATSYCALVFSPLGLQRYNASDEPLQPGATMKGYVALQLPDDWNIMTVEYKPNSADSNDYITYNVSKNDIKYYEVPKD